MLGTGSNTHRNHFLVKEFEIYMRRQDKYTLTINLSIKHRITEDQREAIGKLQRRDGNLSRTLKGGQ